MAKALAFNKEQQESYDRGLKNISEKCDILRCENSCIINYTQEKSSWIIVNNKAINHNLLGNCLGVTFLALAIAGPLYFGKKLYDYCTSIKNQENKIARIDQIIEQLDALVI